MCCLGDERIEDNQIIAPKDQVYGINVKYVQIKVINVIMISVLTAVRLHALEKQPYLCSNYHKPKNYNY